MQENILVNANRLLGMLDSFDRSKVLMALQTTATKEEWWQLLFKWWQSCDFNPQTIITFNLYMQQKKPDFNGMMAQIADEETLKAWNALPDTLTVWRGCYEFNKQGLSWSLDKQEAQNFTSLARYRRPDSQPLLLMGTVSKHDAIYMNKRENEIFSPYVAVIDEIEVTHTKAARAFKIPCFDCGGTGFHIR